VARSSLSSPLTSSVYHLLNKLAHPWPAPAALILSLTSAGPHDTDLRDSDGASSPPSFLPSYRHFLRRQGLALSATPPRCFTLPFSCPIDNTNSDVTYPMRRIWSSLPPSTMTTWETRNYPRVVIRIWVYTCPHLWAYDLHRVRRMTPSAHSMYYKLLLENTTRAPTSPKIPTWPWELPLNASL
jgi:hypothetical protein